MQAAEVRFGPFELDPKAGELWRDGRRVRLQDKPLKLLLALVERPNQIVTREELRAELWPPNIVVEFDNGLNNAVNKLRAALRDSAATPIYIETVGHRGYRFIGSLERASAAIEAVPGEAGLPDARGDGIVRWRPSHPVAIVTVIAVALIGLGAFLASQRDEAPVSSIGSLAVLPLENLSNDPDQEYFSDGLTDALISQLANIRSLRIISRQSVMQYKRSVVPMAAIARELGVDAVIEGTVLRTADRVRISVQLIHAPMDRHLWSAQYERPLHDVLALQSEVARTVAEEIRATVTPEEAVRLAHPATVDPDAYDLYLRGRYLWQQRTEDSLRRSLDYFRRAVAIEPDFPQAYAAMAEAYGPLGYGGYMPPDEATAAMRAAATRALELDPLLVEGHSVLGACAAFHEWNWAEGERHFRRALELSSNYPWAFAWYGVLLENTGRQSENLQARQRAFELEPLGVIGAGLGQALFLNGRLEEGVAVLQRTLELDPDSPQPLSNLAEIYLAQGRFAEAIDAFERAGDDGGLGHAYGMAGRREDALAVLEKLRSRAKDRYVSPHQIALIQLGLGDHAAALDALEQGVEIRDTGMSGVMVDPRFAPLADEPRFVAVLEKMHLR